MRTPANAPSRQRKASVASFLAPTSGWISNFNVAANMQGDQTAATVLDNWWPTPQNVQIRRGCALYCQLPVTDAVSSLMVYNNGGDVRMFAATSDTIYDITTGSTPKAVVTDLSNGNWNYTQFATTGGVFLVAVNGADPMQLFDGQYWWAIDGKDILQLSIGSTTAALQAGDIVTGGTSGATGTLIRVVGANAYVRAINGDTFKSGETVTGAKGGSVTLSADSTTWWSGITVASGNSISTVDTRSFCFVWPYQARLYFIQKDSLNMWYLDADAIGGSATVFPMGGVFPSGGSLMIGASWSLDNSGQGGLSEQCVMITDEGECAIYQGYDPNLSTSWSKVGLYRIDKPRGPNAFARNGGDLLIATDTGLIPLSQAINKAFAQLAPAAVSYPIEHDWNAYVQERSTCNWQMAIWPENQMLAVALPHLNGYTDTFLVANTRTAAWARFTGWNAACLCVFQGQMYFGSDSGKIVAAWQTGADMGAPFTSVYVPLFIDCQAPAVAKMPKDCRVMLRGTTTASWSISMQYDYVLNIPAPPDVAITGNEDVWDEGKWDSAVWSAGAKQTAQKLWTPVAGMGAAFAPCLQITSGNLAPFDNELIRVEVTFVAGGLLS